MPGYLDMHTHALPNADKQPSVWPLLLASGITGIREMGGSPELIQRAKGLNADSAAGRVDAPEIVQIPGDILIGIMSAEQAIARVQQQKAMGADFIKLVVANRDGTLGVIAEGKKNGLAVAGHLPLAIRAQEASDAGWKSVEHLGSGMGNGLDCAADEADVRRAVLTGGGAPPVMSPLAIISPLLYRELDAKFYQRVYNSYDEGKCTALARTFASNGTWQVPTLIRLRTAAFSDDQQYRASPDLAYVDKATRALWEQLAQQFPTKVSPASAATFRQYYGLQQKLVKLYSMNGVKMLAGSDLGGIWVVPGVSLHQEFRELAAAGLSPLHILQMATLNGAEYLGREASMGTVEAGKNADLVLLDANPVEDAANLSRIAGVFRNGKYLSKLTLDGMKRAVAEGYQSQPMKGADSVIDKSHVH